MLIHQADGACGPAWLAAIGPPDSSREDGKVHGANGRSAIVKIFQTAVPESAKLPLLAAVVVIAASCSSVPRTQVAPPPVVSGTPPAGPEANAAVDASRGEFTVAASMLDCWNAVGQLLVRLDGVTYEGRAQMLGMYAVRYRGERFLILTRALVMRSRADGMVTKVGAVLPDGKSSDSVAAVELLGLLQRQLPAELARIAAIDG